MKLTLGIDPGKSGAVVVLGSKGVLDVYDCPIIGKEYDVSGMAKIVKEWACTQFPSDVSVWIEKVHAMPGQGVVSMFGFGKGLGMWIGICAALRVRYTLVAPQTWKKLLLRDMPKEKESSVIVAKQLFPEAEKWLTRKKDHNRADALLIAEYGRRSI